MRNCAQEGDAAFQRLGDFCDLHGPRPTGSTNLESAIDWVLNQLRKDLNFFAVPFAKLATGITTDSRLRKLLANMIYVGVVGELICLE